MNIYTNSYITKIQEISISNKYTKWYCQIVNRAQKRATTRKEAKKLLGYVEGHHLVPECFFINRKRSGPKGWLDGNAEDKSNFSFLTAQEHFIVHWLLTKMFSDKRIYYKMENALCKFMQNQYGNRILTSLEYKRARISAAISASSRSKGKSSPKKGIKTGPNPAISKARKGKPCPEVSKSNKKRKGIRRPDVAERMKGNVLGQRNIGKKRKSFSKEHLDNLKKAQRLRRNAESIKKKISD